jgi:hypothetical protein
VREARKPGERHGPTLARLLSKGGERERAKTCMSVLRMFIGFIEILDTLYVIRRNYEEVD